MRIRVAMSALYDREHREEDALHEIDAALAVEPNDPQMLMLRGIYLTNLGRNAEAVVVLQRAIALDTLKNTQQLALARRVLATAQSRLGRSEENPEALPLAPR